MTAAQRACSRGQQERKRTRNCCCRLTIKQSVSSSLAPLEEESATDTVLRAASTICSCGESSDQQESAPPRSRTALVSGNGQRITHNSMHEIFPGRRRRAVGPPRRSLLQRACRPLVSPTARPSCFRLFCACSLLPEPTEAGGVFFPSRSLTGVAATGAVSSP